jgi:hypothetical protein
VCVCVPCAFLVCFLPRPVHFVCPFVALFFCPSILSSVLLCVFLSSLPSHSLPPLFHPHCSLQIAIATSLDGSGFCSCGPDTKGPHLMSTAHGLLSPAFPHLIPCSPLRSIYSTPKYILNLYYHNSTSGAIS